MRTTAALALSLLLFPVGGCGDIFDVSDELKLAIKIERSINPERRSPPWPQVKLTAPTTYVDITTGKRLLKVRLFEDRAVKAYSVALSHEERRSSFDDIIAMVLASDTPIERIEVSALYPGHVIEDIVRNVYSNHVDVPIATVLFKPVVRSLWRGNHPGVLLQIDWSDEKLKAAMASFEALGRRFR